VCKESRSSGVTGESGGRTQPVKEGPPGKRGGREKKGRKGRNRSRLGNSHQKRTRNSA